jgi:hypothetical protein
MRLGVRVDLRFTFFACFKQVTLGYLGDPWGCPRHRSVSRGNRRKPNKFKIQIETAVQLVRTGLRLGKDRLPVGLGGKPTGKAENPTMFLWFSGDELMKILA